MTHDEAMKLIDDKVKENDVVVFMKGTQAMPMCGFSARVVEIFKHLGQGICDVNVLQDESLRGAIKVYSNWPTIPQIYVKGQFIGGCDITSEMFESGELQTLLKEKLGLNA